MVECGQRALQQSHFPRPPALLPAALRCGPAAWLEGGDRRRAGPGAGAWVMLLRAGSQQVPRDKCGKRDKNLTILTKAGESLEEGRRDEGTL